MNELNNFMFNSDFTQEDFDERITSLLETSPDLNFLENDLPGEIMRVSDAELMMPPQNENHFGGLLYAGEPVITEFTNKKWSANQKRIVFSIRNNEMSSFFDANENLDALFGQIFEQYIQVIPENTIVQYIINHDTFDRPISSSYMKRSQLEACMIQRSFEDVFQSRKKQPENTFQESHQLTLTINVLPSRAVRGGSNPETIVNKRQNDNTKKEPKKRICKEKKRILNMRDFLENCQSVKIINSDNYCLVRAVLVGKAFADKEENSYLLVRKNNRNLNNRLSELLKVLALPDEFLNLTHLKMIEDHLKDYQITVYDSFSNGSSIIFPFEITPEKSKHKKFINIIFENLHFNVITSMTAFYECNYFCQYCKIKYSNLGQHDCEYLCQSCKRYDYVCFEDGKKIKCKDCNIICRNVLCKKLHDSGQCYKMFICETCNFLKPKYNIHICGDSSKYCPICKLSVGLDHNCFISKKVKTKYITKFSGYVWFDIEAFVNEKGFHEANLIMAKRRCIDCLENSLVCRICSSQFSFDNTEEFVAWCLEPYNRNFIFLSHNGRSYDNYFILRYFQNSKTPRDTNIRALTDGLKVLSFSFRTLTFKDSSLFIPGTLESFSKTFNLKESKGFFCHDFNRRENFNYKGPYPSKEFYKPEFFSIEKKKIFETWYETVKNSEFDFQKELKKYCWMDVELLSEGCLEFSKFNRKTSKMSAQDLGLDPIQNNITISSFCNTLYRQKYMPVDSIAWIPTNGFNPKENTSKKAIQWLKYISEHENTYIQHAKNLGEFKIENMKVDGISFELKKIWEFYGCLFHGCEICNGPNTFNPVLQTMNYTLRLRTEARKNKLKKLMPEFEVVVIWEHSWDLMCKNNIDIKEFIKINPVTSTINVRDALYGGRVNALKLYHKCIPNERIHYIDFCSLYPAVQKTCVYPKGHPTIISENFDYTKKYFGIIKCQILPPQNLYLPVLPLKINNKLIFTLCYKCAHEQTNNFNCSHTELERMLTGTWVSLEIDKAIEQGYKLIKYDQIYEFTEKIVYDKETKIGGLFTDYINSNLKAKQEASGYPPNCSSESDKDAYIKSYYDVEGIVLDKENIKKNPGQRRSSKDILCCLWGYFALDSNKTLFKIIYKYSELEKLLEDDQYLIHNIDFCDENFLQVTYSIKKEFCYGSEYTNCIIGAFVTAHARLKLYCELNKLGRRVLYFDTGELKKKLVF
jgi:hypothetical protein